jgi:hypothetical protein
MLKIAVIVVGSHYAGKSKTINKHLKWRLGIRSRAHKFTLRGACGKVLSQSREEAARRSGFARSQSLEESRRTSADVRNLIRAISSFDRLVFAARPSDEKPSFLPLLKSSLGANGFRVFLVRGVPNRPDRFYAERAKEILRHLTL